MTVILTPLQMLTNVVGHPNSWICIDGFWSHGLWRLIKCDNNGKILTLKLVFGNILAQKDKRRSLISQLKLYRKTKNPYLININAIQLNSVNWELAMILNQNIKNGLNEFWNEPLVYKHLNIFESMGSISNCITTLVRSSDENCDLL